MTDVTLKSGMFAQFDDERVRLFLLNLEKKVKKVDLQSNDYMILLNAIVFKDVIRHFERQEGSEGMPWKQWSPSYLASKIAKTLTKSGRVRKGRRGFVGKLLQDTGRLRNKFTPTSFRKDDNGIVWFNNARTKKGFPYAFAHDTGGPKLPKRSFMWLSNDAIKQIESDTLEFLLGN